MAKPHLFHIILILWIKNTQTGGSNTEFNGQSVYVTKNNTSYDKISETCKLLGSSMDIFQDDIRLNISGTFWIAGQIKFKRNVNPIGKRDDFDFPITNFPFLDGDVPLSPSYGVYISQLVRFARVCSDVKDFNERFLPMCSSKHHVSSLDECIKQCRKKNMEYVIYGNQTGDNFSCSCENEKPHLKDGILYETETCKNRKDLCPPSGCTVFQTGINKSNLHCGTYTHENDSWNFEVNDCFKRQTNSFICENDNDTIKHDPTNVSWYEAFHFCKENQSTLLENYQCARKFNKDNRTYWVSFFRQSELSWGKDSALDERQTICVAAKVTPNKTLKLVTQFCHQPLQSICHKQENMFNLLYILLPSTVGCCLMILLMLSGFLVKYRRLIVLRKIGKQIKKHKTEQAGAEINEPVDLTETEKFRNSQYSLAKAYCEPWKSFSIMDTTICEEDQTYDHASHTRHSHVSAENHYDHVVENYYEDPIS